MHVRERSSLLPTPPGRDYHAPEVHERDRERVFAGGWACVGREDHVASPGDYLTRELAGEPIVVVRGKDGVVWAFANACRHRGTRLLDGQGCVRSAIRCPYHAWTYGLDGAFLGAPSVTRPTGWSPTGSA